ncbi:hypothetical protein BBFGKLBO_03031 [Synechococcus sp. CBW1107]|uniref:hypothetical protein n=1 Tax=Synechococcus sp. CBW1107 TaxID=2789857 RepID=UPI002AD4E444|nr:hypothetical protein [Synechococcus sp. CBW1107]CAK6701150.1 hypothetical protein BBFGKLBO_03031 [Synechococcus sp. CBW1107]
MTTTTTASRTRPTVDPFVVEILSPPHWRWKLTVPRALLAHHGHHAVAEALAAYSPHPVCLQGLDLGRCSFVVFATLEQASAAAGALRNL